MPFDEHLAAPAGFATGEFVLRPITVADVALDHAAVGERETQREIVTLIGRRDGQDRSRVPAPLVRELRRMVDSLAEESVAR